MSYYSLHNHTMYSNVRFLDCTNNPKDLINKAIELGLSGIAITDHECISSTVELLSIRDEVSKSHPGFRIFFGNEIYLIDETEVHNTRNFYHFILIAKDMEGWDQVRKLSSRAWGRGYMERGQMRVPTTYQDIEEIVGTNPGHVLASSACLGGYLPKAILANDTEKAKSFVQWMIKNFGQENVAMELQVSDSEEQTICNKALIQLAKQYNILYTITTDSHYLTKEDAPIHAAFLNSKLDDDRETEKFYKYTYVMSEREMMDILEQAGFSDEVIIQGFENTEQFTSSIVDFDTRCGTIVPNSKIPKFELSYSLYKYCQDGKYPNIKLFYERDSQEDRYLIRLLERGLEEKHIPITEERLERLEIELDVINVISEGLHQKVSSYFLLMREVIDIAWRYSFVGAGRGSSSAFYITYLLDLVQIDPLKYDLPYFRFLNKERFELPKQYWAG